MPITAIDAQSALVVIDIQKGILAMPTVQPAREILENVLRLGEIGTVGEILAKL